MRTLAQAKEQLQRRGITQERIAREVRRIFPDRTCSKWMVNAVLNGRAKSSYVSVAIDQMLSAAERGHAKRNGVLFKSARAMQTVASI